MKKIIALLMSLCMAFGLIACSKGTTTTPETTTATENVETETTTAPKKVAAFKIGGIGPITGGAAVYGLAVKNGGQIAVDRINAEGGINGYPVEYMFEDDEHDAEKAVNAYNTLKDKGMQMLDGTTTSSPCIAVADKSSNDNLFQITPSGSAVECATNDNVFRICYADPDQGIASANYINDHNLATKVGIIHDSSDVYSTGIYEKFLETSEGLNFEVVADEQFTSDSKTDFTTQLTKIKDAGADLVFLPFYYNEAALVLNQAKSMSYEPKFFSCDGMDGILSLDNFDTTLAEGVMLLTPFSADASDSLTKSFVDEYKRRFGEVPNQFAADSFDAIYAMKAAIENRNVTPDMSVTDICNELKQGMVEISINGLTGENMVWTADGEPKKAPKAVKIVDGAYQLME